MESKFVKIKGNYNIHYLEEGDSEKVLILLHGIPVNSSLYKKVIPLLSKDFKVIAPDFIGFGKSDKPLNFEYNLKGYTEVFKDFINALGIKSFSVCAMDLGLMVALNYMSTNAKAIKNLILMEGFIYPVNTTVQNMGFSSRFALTLMKNDKIAKDLILKNGEKTIKSFINSGLINKLSDLELDEYINQFKDKDLREKLWFKGLGPHTIKSDEILTETIENYHKKLLNSEIPKLLLYGEPGQLIKKELVESAKINFKNIEVKSIGQGKHFLPLDQAENVAEAILNFIGEDK